jgi:hypothetical protein
MKEALRHIFFIVPHLYVAVLAVKRLLGIYNLSKKRAFLAATLLDFSP